MMKRTRRTHMPNYGVLAVAIIALLLMQSLSYGASATFFETGLSSGSTWHVSYDNVTGSSSGNTITISVPSSGSYQFTVSNTTTEIPYPQTGTAATNSITNIEFYSSGLCTTLIPTTGKLSSMSIQNGILSVSLLIILLMFSVIGLVFAIGYALRINLLTNFSKNEFGEIIITLVIIMLFLGTLSAASSALPASNSGALYKYPWDSIFARDCNIMVGQSFGMLGNYRVIAIESDMYSYASSISVSLAPDYFGVSFTPYSGLSMVKQILKVVLSFTGLIISVFFGLAVFLSIIFNLFPVFLYAGIVLRTIPWTRAAGGAFLGLFIGFYIFMPLTIGFVSITNIPILVSPSMSSNAFTLSSFTSITNFVGSIGTLLTFISGNVINAFIESVIAPSLYLLAGLLIAVMLSLDFAETVGDFLGAPSLSTGNALKGVI